MLGADLQGASEPFDSCEVWATLELERALCAAGSEDAEDGVFKFSRVAWECAPRDDPPKHLISWNYHDSCATRVWNLATGLCNELPQGHTVTGTVRPGTCL